MSEILYSVDEGIATLTINRPEKKNSITANMYAALAEHLQQAAGDEHVRVLVIQGHETVFSAGNDLQDFMQQPFDSLDAPVARFLLTLIDFAKPVVAAVCGAAVGIGSTLLLHCDLVIAADTAKFSFPFVNLGLCPEAASSMLLPQQIGYHRAAEALLLGESISAADALAMGFVNRVASVQDVATLARAQALKIAAQPLPSLIATKELMKKGQREAARAQLLDEFEMFTRMLKEPAASEAFTAFFERRSPDFKSVGA